MRLQRGLQWATENPTSKAHFKFFKQNPQKTFNLKVQSHDSEFKFKDPNVINTPSD